MKTFNLFLLTASFLVQFTANAQQLTKAKIVDLPYLSDIKEYIPYSKGADDSLGIVMVHVDTTGRDLVVDLEFVKEERASYFKTINVPSRYAYIEGRLVFFYDKERRSTPYTDSFLAEIDRITEGRFKKMEEDRGAFVARVKGPDGVVHKSRYLVAGNSKNAVTIYFYADGTRKKFQRI